MTAGKLPRRLPIVESPAGTELWRIHRRTHAPLWFSRESDFRFNAPGEEYGVCYLGDSLEVSFLETLVRGSRFRIVSRAALTTRFGTAIAHSRSLRLLRLYSDGLVALGLSADVPHHDSYAECQQLALAAWQHPDTVDGIEYRSRWDDSRLCAAIFDRAASALKPAGDSVPLDDLARISSLLRYYGIRVI